MVLGKKVIFSNGAMNAIFWLEGWLNMPSILKEIAPLVAPHKILSINVKYIHGLKGEETEVHVFAVRVIELEVQDGREES